MTGGPEVQNEQALIERAKSNDPEAFAAIYEEHFDMIYRYVFLRVGNQMEAEDLTQQVFLNAMKAISSYKWRGAPFSSWLFRIAHNQVIDFHRRAAKAQVTIIEAPIVAANPDPAEVAEREVDIKRIKEAMKELTQLQQEVIAMRFAGELTTAETAKIMGKSEGAVKALQHSALAALRKMLAGGWDYVQEA